MTNFLNSLAFPFFATIGVICCGFAGERGAGGDRGIAMRDQYGDGGVGVVDLDRVGVRVGVRCPNRALGGLLGARAVRPTD